VTFYQDLCNDTEQAKTYLLSAPIINDVLQGNFVLSTYAAFLNQAYHHVKHTVPLLMGAGSKLNDSQSWLLKPIAQYIAEEIGHEAWILDDLEHCGYNRVELETAAAPYTSELMVSYLYDYVNRKNPVGIFGMVLVLEGTSSDLAPMVGQIVQQKLVLPDAAMTYLTTHGELDQAHISHFEQLMNKVTDKRDQQAIIEVANRVYHLYGDVYRSIATESKLLGNRKMAA
jgi:thiaminase